MDILMFFYNITITLAFGFCCVNFFILYGQHRDKRLLCLSLVFFLFILDNLVLYMREFLPEFSNYYNQVMLATPFISNCSTLAICFSYRLTLLTYNESEISKRETILWILIAIAEFTTTALYKYPVCSIASILIMSGAAIGAFSSGLYHIKKHGAYPKTEFAPSIPVWFLLIGLLLETAAATENVLHYYRYELIGDRVISIELIGILFAVSAIVFIFRSMEQDFFEKKNNDEGMLGWCRDLEKFSEAYSLTMREREILKYLIKGYSIEQICAEACIAQGTVKSHTHNIYQKLDVTNKIQLLTRLREFNEEEHIQQ